ncbi:ankyrin 3 [Fusarium mundagurra]|uniref:Ankyrin 3 n=1 Tax=Fusarium mundagurra TaxID=1567541 RepID=A0A8H6DPK5_9HYPO|nr:ankyrin 3 [Fusarium mundagurra]
MKDKIIISFFFNARGEQLEKSTTGMYRSLLLQILQQLPTLHSALDPALVLGIGENHEWNIEALRALFEQAVEGLGNSSVVVFIDALDECDESEIRSMVSSFKSLGNLSVAEGISFQKIELLLEGQEGHEQDIVSYLDSELDIGESKLAQEVRAQIKEKASGVFMWVVLVASILQEKFDGGLIHTLKQTLREIPGDLHDLFRDILTRDDSNKDELVLCIQWILFARNPLKPEQLYFAIRSHTECTTCKWDRDEIEEVTIGKFILSTSKGLAEVTRVKKDPTVQFIHESVRDFLLKDNGLRVILMDVKNNIAAESHDQLKRCCFDYIELYTAEHGELASDSKEQLVEARSTADSDYPFLRYAVQNVLYHANTAEEGHISQTRFLETLQLAKWIQHNNLFEDKDVRRQTTDASLLYLLAEYNFGSLIESHLGSQSCFDIESERHGAPILAAMATGSRATVWRLLKREIREEPATSRLHSLCNEYDVEKKPKQRLGRRFKFNTKSGILYYILKEDDLIAASVAVASSKPYTHLNFGTIRGKTPFSVALKYSQDVCSTFGFLIANGADIEARDGLVRTPLCLAAANGDTAAVAILLEKGANVENRSITGMTPLMFAAKEGSEECMRLLISGGANVNAKDNQRRTALFLAAYSRKEPEVKVHLLVDHGADVAAIDGNGCTVLAWLLGTRRATETMVHMLLNRDTVNKPQFLGRTPLMLALSNSLWITKQIIDGGAGIDLIDNQGQSALLLAVKLKAEAQARLLIDSGAHTDVSDTRNHRTALSYAVSSQYYDIISFPQGHPTTELLYHSQDLPPSIAEALLIRGAAVDRHDINGRTPLSYAAGASVSADFVSLLLSHGANVDRADNNGRTPLSYAASSHGFQYKSCMRLLLDAGAIPDKIDKDGKTALSYATTDRDRYLLSSYLYTSI